MTVSGGEVDITVKRIQASYAGKISDERRSIRGTWKQTDAELPSDLERLDEEPAAARPQEPKRHFRAWKRKSPTPVEPIKLAATLSRPKTGRLVPAVVLINGLGP